MPGLTYANWAALAALAAILVLSAMFAFFDNRRRRRDGTAHVGPQFVEVDVPGRSKNENQPKPNAAQKNEIARLSEATPTDVSLGITAGVMLFGGLVGMTLVVMFGSYIAMAAWGTVWTGWNVFWGALLLMTRRRDYIVFRSNSD